MSNKPPAKCVVSRRLSGDLQTACFGLDQALEMQFARSGLVPMKLTRIEGHRSGESHQVVAAKSGKHRKIGVLLNFCPFCGKRLTFKEKHGS